MTLVNPLTFLSRTTTNIRGLEWNVIGFDDFLRIYLLSQILHVFHLSTCVSTEFLTHTSKSLCSVSVSDPDNQRQEVDFAEPTDGPLYQPAATTGADTAAAQGPTCQPAVSVTHEPFWPGLSTLQLVLTTTLQSQSQTLVTWRHRERQELEKKVIDTVFIRCIDNVQILPMHKEFDLFLLGFKTFENKLTDN